MSTSLVVIGAGVMGSVYANAVAETNLRWRTDVVGVCDPDADAGERLAKASGARAFTDVNEMFDALQPDAAYIASPDHLHVDPFMTCIERGVPCLVEKPLATDAATAIRMREEARRTGVYAECNFTNRSNPVFVRVREAIVRGDVGDVLAINARLSNAIAYPSTHLRWAGSSSSGWFLLSHVFDLASWLSGARATEVTATGNKRVLLERGVDTYDVIQALVRYENGTSGLYESSWTLPDSLPTPVDFKVEVLGSEGALYVDTNDQMVHLAGKDRYTYPGTLNWTEARLTEFLDRVDGAERPVDPLAEAVENTLLVMALHESIASRAAVRVASLEEISGAAEVAR